MTTKVVCKPNGIRHVYDSHWDWLYARGEHSIITSVESTTWRVYASLIDEANRALLGAL